MDNLLWFIAGYIVGGLWMLAPHKIVKAIGKRVTLPNHAKGSR
jgi:hypothetical protein